MLNTFKMWRKRLFYKSLSSELVANILSQVALEIAHLKNNPHEPNQAKHLQEAKAEYAAMAQTLRK